MHEGNFTGQIVQAIMFELKKYPDHKPKRIKVKVGEMLHLDRESIKMHYLVLTKGTALEGAEIDLEEIPVNVYCWQCNRMGCVKDHHMPICSNCSSTDVEVMSGNEILVDSIDLETGA